MEAENAAGPLPMITTDSIFTLTPMILIGCKKRKSRKLQKMEDTTTFIQNKQNSNDISENNPKQAQIKKYDEYTCDICGENDVDQSIRTAFKVNYCKQCRARLQLVAQSTAVNEYLLTKDDLRGLQRMKAANPKNEDWNPMILYRKSDIERISQNKYVDIEEEKRIRKEKQKERKKKALKKKLSLLRRSLRPKIKEEIAHVHTFDAVGKCVCGIVVEYEEI